MKEAGMSVFWGILETTNWMQSGLGEKRDPNQICIAHHWQFPDLPMLTLSLHMCTAKDSWTFIPRPMNIGHFSEESE